MAIASGALRGAALLERILEVPVADRDAWIDEALGGALEPPPDRPDLPRGAVPYLPCGVDAILAMVRDVPVTRDDELVDLGSGLGRVAIIGHLLTGARARGIEIQDHLVASARARCAELGLHEVTFVHANAADIELPGTVFFLYAPCNGAMLASLVDRLEAAARNRPIVVCTVDFELPDRPWLVPRASSCTSLTVYRSRVAT